MPDLDRSAGLHSHAHANAKWALWLDVELQRLEVLAEGIHDLAECHGLGVLKLLFCPEAVLWVDMSAIRAVTGEIGAFESSPKLHLEVALAVLLRAFASGVPFSIRRDANVDAVAKSAQVPADM